MTLEESAALSRQRAQEQRDIEAQSAAAHNALMQSGIQQQQTAQTSALNNPYTQGAKSPQQAAGALSVAKQQGDVNYNVDPTGTTSYSNASAQARETDNNSARLQAEAEARRQQALLGLWNSTGGGVGAGPQVTRGGVGGNEEAARAAAFARAKDQSGRLATAGLKSVQDNMAARGISGSGIQDMKDAGVIQGAEAPLQELTRDQLMMDLNRTADISDQTYQGNITQRGQDMAAKQAQMQQLMGLFSVRY